MDTFLDTTIRPLCFEINPNISKESASGVGPETFKKYEYVLYSMAQLSRIVYCDTGIIHRVVQSSLGLSNDVVNKVISAYDWKYAKERRTPIQSQKGLENRPMESYSLGSSGSGKKYATYVSSPEDVTAIVLNGSSFKANPNSIFLPSDIFMSFKGSSTIDNFKHDIMSQFTSTDLQVLIESLEIKVEGSDNKVTGAFVSPLVNCWRSLIQSITDHIQGKDVRLFLTGHSLGGAYASLFAFILAEGKVSDTLPVMQKIKSIHLITFGAPCLLSDIARNTFNRHLNSGLITLDRVVSQKVPARSAATQLLVGGIAGPNDVIPTIPAGFSHPGYRPLSNPLKNIYPESKGRPYSLDYIRKTYGIPGGTRYRDAETWPFNEEMGLGDRAMTEELNKIVTDLTKLENIPQEKEVVAPNDNVNPEDPVQQGGASAKNIYSDETLHHIPNLVSVQGSVYAFGFAHAEYLGMFFMGGFRLMGMKNPGFKRNTAFFELYPNGVKIQYYEPKQASEMNLLKSTAEVEPDISSEDPVAPANVGGRRKNRRKSIKLRHARRRYTARRRN